MAIEYEYNDDESEGEEYEFEEQISEEMEEIDVWEFVLSNEEIDHLIVGLKELKKSKSHFHFNIDEDNEIIIHHEDEFDEESDDKTEEKEGKIL